MNLKINKLNISPQQQLFLFFTGINIYEISNKNLTLDGIAFKLKSEYEDVVKHLASNKYLLYIKLDSKFGKEDVISEFSKELAIRNNNIISTLLFDGYIIIIAECLEKYVEDWNKAKKGQYKEMSILLKNEIKNQYSNSGWDEVFEVNKTQIIKHIESRLSRENRTPLEIKQISTELYEKLENKEQYQLLSKPKFNYV